MGEECKGSVGVVEGCRGSKSAEAGSGSLVNCGEWLEVLQSGMKKSIEEMELVGTLRWFCKCEVIFSLL